MNNIQEASNIYIDIARRVKRYRIEYPMTQAELSEKSGVSLRTIKYFEDGQEIKLLSFIKILDALDLSKNFDILVPDMDARPSILLNKERGSVNKRAKTKKNNSDTGFVWGDDK